MEVTVFLTAPKATCLRSLPAFPFLSPGLLLMACAIGGSLDLPVHVPGGGSDGLGPGSCGNHVLQGLEAIRGPDQVVVVVGGYSEPIC